MSHLFQTGRFFSTENFSKKEKEKKEREAGEGMKVYSHYNVHNKRN